MLNARKRLRLIAGLGNPGARYAATRHNIGFLLLEKYLLPYFQLTLKRGPSGGAAAVLKRESEEIHFLLPARYMNRSGEVVADYLERTGIQPGEMLVVSDCLDLEFGKMRIRASGSSGGHRGIESIIECTGTPSFARLRIGIGRPPEGTEPSDYVLEPFSGPERELLTWVLEDARKVVLAWFEAGLKEARDVLSGLKHAGPR